MNKQFEDFHVSCINCNLDTICLPRGLSQQEIENLNGVIKNNSILQQGEYVYRQGDEFKGIIAIKSGMAKLVANDNEGNEHILCILLPGELAGFDGLNKNEYNCSVVALDVLSYCSLPLSAERFNSVCQKIPSIALELFKHSSESICESQNQIISNKRSAEEKIAFFCSIYLND